MDVWGNAVDIFNPYKLRQPIRMQGQHYDEESGLHYNRHRYYDPMQGRYITQDPIGLRGGWNLYAYPLDPVLGRDPLGLETNQFESADKAALYAIRMCNADSISENKEFGGLICKNRQGYFSTAPVKGTNAGVNPYSAACPKESDNVGVYHTHGYYSDKFGNITLKKNDFYDTLHFSEKDKDSANYFSKGKSEFSSYLGKPDNTYSKYNPKSEKISDIK